MADRFPVFGVKTDITTRLLSTSTRSESEWSRVFETWVERFGTVAVRDETLDVRSGDFLEQMRLRLLPEQDAMRFPQVFTQPIPGLDCVVALDTSIRACPTFKLMSTYDRAMEPRGD